MDYKDSARHDSLASTLQLPKESLASAVQLFINECDNTINNIIDDILKIGDISIKTKAETLDQLYGKNFKSLYPDLAQKLPLQDEELTEAARKKIESSIKPEDFGANEAMIREQLIYISEVAPKVTPTEEFAKLFKERTGLTMREYKEKVAANTSSIWNAPQSTTSSAAAYEPARPGM